MKIKIIADLRILLCGYICLTVHMTLQLKNFKTLKQHGQLKLLFQTTNDDTAGIARLHRNKMIFL